MRPWRNFYLVRLFFIHKGLAFFVAVFFIINVAANVYVPTQITPVYNWNLYAYPLPDQDTFQFTVVQYNKGEILKFKHTWNQPQKVLMSNTLDLFVANQIDGHEDYSETHFRKNWLPNNAWFARSFPHFINFPTQKEFEAFPHWYRRYLSQHSGTSIDSILFIRKGVIFNERGRVDEVSSNIIFKVP